FEKYPRPNISTSNHDRSSESLYVDPDYYFMYPYIKTDGIELDKITSTRNVEPANIKHTYLSYNENYNGGSGSGSGSGNIGGADIPFGGGGENCTTPSYPWGHHTKLVTLKYFPSYNTPLTTPISGATKQFIDICLSQKGNGYKLGAMGEHCSSSSVLHSLAKSYGGRVNIAWVGKTIFDCSGIILWAMWQMGQTSKPVRTSDMGIVNSYCTRISESELRPGDLLVQPGVHIAVYLNNGNTIEAANPDRGVITGKKDHRYTLFARIKWSQQVLQRFSGVKDKPNKPTGNSLGNSTITDEANDMIFGDLKPYSYENVKDEEVNKHTRAPVIGDSPNDTVNGGVDVSNQNQAQSRTIKLGRFGDDKDRHDAVIQKYCRKWGLAPNWMKALIYVESTMREWIGPNGCNAVGLMQITTDPCSEMGYEYNVSKLKNPEYNVNIGCHYLSKFKKQVKGNYLDLCCLHNCGPNRFASWQLGPGHKNYKDLPNETKNHRARCEKIYNQLMSKGGQAGEYKADGSIGIDPTISGNGGFSDSGTESMQPPTQEISKEHGNIKIEYKEKIGTPFVGVSPINNLIQAESVEIPSTGTEDSLSIGGAQIGKPPTDPKYKEMVNNFLDEKNEHYVRTMTVDDKSYNKRGTMLRAFPTYSLLLSDEDSSWFDAKKLWANYYPYKSIVSINIHHEREFPVGTATIQVTNMSNNLMKNLSLDRIKNSIANDDEYSEINQFLYKHWGFMVGSPKVTDKMIDMKNKLVTEMKIKPGTRVHIRLGYGSDPLGLNVSFNGTVAEVSNGDIIEMVAQSDGVELINKVVSSKEGKTNGMTKFQSEASNIISSLLIDRASWTNVFNKKWGEASEFGIEHFGLFTGHNKPLGREKEYDLCKNIYVGNYKKKLFCNQGMLEIRDGETTTKMYLYNKTPWDVAQTIAQTLPEFCCQPIYHQFDSRVFFGMPTWLCKFRYDLDDSGQITEFAKTFQQVHIIDGDDIIDNKLKCSSKTLFTNAVVMYTLGSSMKGTPTLYADRSIDWSKQNTKVIDSTLEQDYLGPDAVYEFFGLKPGKSNSISIGVSNLLDSFDKMYFDDIVCLGKPGIKPMDLIHINDDFSEMYGMANVREVTHSFGPEVGFCTTISPGLIGFSKTQDGGSANVHRSIVNLNTTVSQILTAKRETNSAFSQISSAMYEEAFKNNKELLRDFRIIAKNVLPYANRKDWLEKLKSKLGTDSGNAIKDVINAMDRIGYGNFGGPKIMFDLLMKIPGLSSIHDFFQYSNCIGIRPLLHKGSKFVVGATKGATKLFEGHTDNPWFDKSMWDIMSKIKEDDNRTDFDED
ncbi:MAG: transglycosylase SLT domain-containing protein, partial [Cetobacterium sp.]